MVQKVIIKRATMKGDGAEGNPKGYFLGTFKVDGMMKVFTSDYEVLTAEEFARQKESKGKQMLTKTFRNIADSLVITYDDESTDHIHKQKLNFCKELIKHPEMRHFDDPKSRSKYWTVEYGNEVSVRKAAKLSDIIKVLNILTTMSYRDRVNICFYFAPELRPDTRLNSELFSLLGDTKTDGDNGRPVGILLNSDERIKAVFNYFKNGEESQFRTTVMKALEFGVIQYEGRGYYLNSEFIGADKESVYQYLKKMPNIFDRYVLPAVAAKDNLLEDDLKQVEMVSYELSQTDYGYKSLEELRAIAKNMKIPYAHVLQDKDKIIAKIEAKNAELAAKKAENDKSSIVLG